MPPPSKQNEAIAPKEGHFAECSKRPNDVRIVRDLNDLLMVFMIRASVYGAEQDCSFVEQFDANDHCATHFIGFIEGEPAGCLRARFFDGSVRLERLAVRKSFRESTLASDLVRAGIDFAHRNGFTRIYGHSRGGLSFIWARFGANSLGDREQFVLLDDGSEAG
jgi:predicted GNAT family N-acyltransferase